MTNHNKFTRQIGALCIFCIVNFFLTLFYVDQAYSADAIPKIRVALNKGLVGTSFSVSEGKYALIDRSTGLTIGNPLVGEKWTVTVKGTNFSVVKNGQEQGSYTGPMLLQPSVEGLNVFSCNNTLYRDVLSFELSSGTLLVINTLDLEKYLYGVVGQEIGYGVPEESLKAQAVVSRSFALSSKGGNLKYDVTNNTSSQVYKGYSAELIAKADRVKKAIDDTFGEVIYYYDDDKRSNRLVKAYFHANSGGYTEDSENVWSEYLPYIRAVASPQDEKALTYLYQTSGWPASTYKWSKSFTKEELNKQIEKWNNLALSRKQSYNIIDVGEILGIYAFNYKQDGVTPTESKRITRLDIVGEKGTKSFFKDAIRSIFELKSTKFTVSSGAELYVLGVDDNKPKTIASEGIYLASNDQTTLYNPSENGALHLLGQGGANILQQDMSTITFDGYGYGHGLGMSQWGARGMAEDGYNYKEIIEHYYNQDKMDGRLTISKNY